MRGRGDAAERQRVVGIAAAADFAAGKLDVVGQHVELLGGDGFELVAHLRRGHMRRHRGARGEAARIGAGRDRPLILGGVDFQHHFDVVGLQPEFARDDLRQHGLVALALHRDVGGDRHRAERIDIDPRHRHRAVFRAGFFARLRGHQGREIAHVGHRRLDDGGKADAVFAPGGAGFVAAALERVEPAAAEGLLDRAQIIAGIVKRAGRRMVGKFLRRNEIAADDVERIEIELHRDALHQPLQRQIKLRPAKAADQARRHFVGEHDAVGHLDIGDVVGAGHRAVHAVERPRHRRAQKRAVILELIEFQPENAAVVGDRGLDLR